MPNEPICAPRINVAPARQPILSVLADVLLWAAAGTSYALATSIGAVFLRALVTTVTRDVPNAFAAAMGGALYYGIFAAVVALFMVLPVATIFFGAWALAFRLGGVTEESRSRVFLYAFFVGLVGAIVYLALKGASFTDSPADTAFTGAMMWFSATFGIVAPRLFIDRLRIGRFSRRGLPGAETAHE